MKSLKKIFIPLITWSVAASLLWFTLRRWVFMLIALNAKQANAIQIKPDATPQNMPQVLLLVPFRDEADTLPALLQALTSLTYPLTKFTLALVDDGSTDRSAKVIEPYLAQYANWHLLQLPENQGKAKALSLALNHFADGEIIAVYDADERPQPHALCYLVEALRKNSNIGAVSGRRIVSNALVSPAASYTAFESLVHQLLTTQAKDKLNLAPPILGSNCAYRRQALVEVGGFREVALLEDSDLTLKLAYAGWQTRFIQQAISYHQAPKTLRGYWRQHVRWARGFYQTSSTGRSGMDSKLPPIKKISFILSLELLTFSLGYVDRLALIGGLLLLILQQGTKFPRWVMNLYLITPLMQVVAALRLAQAPLNLWLRLGWLPLFFLIDIAMTVASTISQLFGFTQTWESRQQRQ